METLIEKLHNNNVIFSYYGFIDHTVLTQVLQITTSKLEHNNEDRAVIRRVNAALEDCVENIISHNFYPDDERLHYKSLLAVSKHEDQYLIDTLNVINDVQKKVIDRQLDFLSSHSKAELEQLMSSPSECPVSARLISMVFKADEYDCSFKPLDQNYLFNINFKILTPVAVTARK